MEKYSYEYNYPIEYYSPPHVHLEYDYNTKNDLNNLNEAEIKALHLEEYKNKCEEIKKLKNKQFIQQCNKNALVYQEEEKLKNKEEETIKKIQKQEKILKNQNFNKTVYEKNMRPFSQRITKSKMLDKYSENAKNTKNSKNGKKVIKIINHINENQNDNDNIIYDDIINERIIPKKSVKKS